MLTLLERPKTEGLCLVRAIQWSPDGNHVAAVQFQQVSGVSTSTVMLWTPAESVEPKTLDQQPGRIRTLTFTADGRYLVGGIGQNWVRAWRTSGNNEAQDLPIPSTDKTIRHDAGPESHYRTGYALVSAPPTGNVLIARGELDWYQWDIVAPKRKHTMRPKKFVHVDSMQITADGSTLVFSDRERVKCFNMNKGFGRPRTLAKEQGCERVIVSRCAERYAYISGSKLKVGHINHPRRKRVTISGHQSFVYAAVFGPDGRTVLTGGQDGSTRVWDIDRRQELARYDWGVGRVTSIDLSPDGGTVVTGGDGEQSVVMWDLD